MRSAVRKHLRDFAAIVGLVVLAAVVSVTILGNQRFTLPSWVPVIGKDFYEFKGEFTTAQAVTPGQGQTVNVAGVPVGQIARVDLVGGKAVVGMRLSDQHVPVYRDATMLLRPKTGLKDMTVELNPGTPEAGRLPDGGTIPVSQTAPDVNLDEILAALDDDTRTYLKALVAGAGTGLKGRGGDLGDTMRAFKPTARALRRINEALATRRDNVRRVMHNFSLLAGELGAKDEQLARFVTDSNAVMSILARQESDLRATLRNLSPALGSTRSALAKTETLASELGPAMQAMLPAARRLAPALREVQPFMKRTTPVLRDSVRPLVRESRPVVRELRPAMRDMSSATPNLDSSLRVLNRLFDMLAYNPPGVEEGFLFWSAWVNHLGASVFSIGDAHGPIRRGAIVASCATLRIVQNVAAVNPPLATVIGLTNLPLAYCEKSQNPAGQVTPPATTPSGEAGG